MRASAQAATRVPVSMRLPYKVAEAVDAYAAHEHVRKTDAYLHFIELGLQASRGSVGVPETRLLAIEERLDEISGLLRGRLAEREDGRGLQQQVASAVASAAALFPAIERAYLFGSIARGTADMDSDIDVRLELDRARRFNLRDLEHFCKLVEQATGRQVDAVTSREIKDEALAAAIERDRVLAYER